MKYLYFKEINMLETLRYSLRNKRIIEIMYHGSQGITQRRVKVLKMDSEKVLAYCYTHKGIRSFKLDSILGASIIHEEE